MTTPTTPLPSVDPERSSHPLLSVFLPTALTLAAVLGIGVWLLRADGPAAPVVTSTPEQRPAGGSAETLTEQERDRLAGLQNDFVQGWQPPPPYVVYLVESAEQQRAMTERGLVEGEAILLAGTPAEQAAAYAHIALLEMNAPTAPAARAVRVIDLRPPPGPAATAPAPTLGGPPLATGAVSGQEMYSQWQAGQRGAASDALQPRQTEVVQIVYLAGSTEQADAIRRGIAEADAIRADVAAPPLTAHTAVLVIAAGEEAQILRGLGDADAIRESLGLPGLMVVDLRTPA